MKKLIMLLLLFFCCVADGQADKVIVKVNEPAGIINKNIYGQFAEHLGLCIYDGVWVGEDSSIPNTHGIRKDVLEILKKIDAPLIRWPGGCFADKYHWRDGIGPRDQRPSFFNIGYDSIETNQFGTHEFMDLCEMLGADAYICGNVGSGTVEEMMDWIEYLNFDGDTTLTMMRKANGHTEPFKVRFWGVGNENYGCGGTMTADYYCDLYMQYQTFLFGLSGNWLYKIAGAYNTDWTETLMKRIGKNVEGISVHYYIMPDCCPPKKGATDFDEAGWFNVMKSSLYTDALIKEHTAIMDKYDPDKRVGLIFDEWGAWVAEEPNTPARHLYQQNTLRDALLAAVSLNIFNNHCDRVKMTTIAQMINVLQSMALTDGTKLIVTPTYHVYEMYKVHQNAKLLPTEIEHNNVYEYKNEKVNSINVSASKSTKDGKVNVTLCNMNPHKKADVELVFDGFVPTDIYGRVLTAEKMNAHNTFEDPEALKPVEFKEFKAAGEKIELAMPAKSVVIISCN